MGSLVLLQVACAGTEMSNMARSLAYLMPGLNGWDSWSFFDISLLSIQPLHLASLGFLTAWRSQSSQASFMAADFHQRKKCEILGVFSILVCLFIFMSISFLCKHIWWMCGVKIQTLWKSAKIRGGKKHSRFLYPEINIWWTLIKETFAFNFYLFIYLFGYTGS